MRLCNLLCNLRQRRRTQPVDVLRPACALFMTWNAQHIVPRRPACLIVLAECCTAACHQLHSCQACTVKVWLEDPATCQESRCRQAPPGPAAYRRTPCQTRLSGSVGHTASPSTPSTAVRHCSQPSRTLRLTCQADAGLPSFSMTLCAGNVSWESNLFVHLKCFLLLFWRAIQAVRGAPLQQGMRKQCPCTCQIARSLMTISCCSVPCMPHRNAL